MRAWVALIHLPFPKPRFSESEWRKGRRRAKRAEWRQGWPTQGRNKTQWLMNWAR